MTTDRLSADTLRLHLPPREPGVPRPMRVLVVVVFDNETPGMYGAVPAFTEKHAVVDGFRKPAELGLYRRRSCPQGLKRSWWVWRMLGAERELVPPQ